MTLGNVVYEFRSELAAKIPEYGFFSGVTAIALWLVLSPFSVAPKIRKKLSRPTYRTIRSTGSDGVERELIIASKAALARPGNYLIHDHNQWVWARVVLDGGVWRHEILPTKAPAGEDVAGIVALGVVGASVVATIALIALNRFA